MALKIEGIRRVLPADNPKSRVEVYVPGGIMRFALVAEDVADNFLRDHPEVRTAIAGSAPFSFTFGEYDDPSISQGYGTGGDAEDDADDMEVDNAGEGVSSFDAEGSRSTAKAGAKPEFKAPEAKVSGPKDSGEADSDGEGSPSEGDGESDGSGGGELPPTFVLDAENAPVPFDDAFQPRAEALGQAVMEQTLTQARADMVAGMVAMKADVESEFATQSETIKSLGNGLDDVVRDVERFKSEVRTFQAENKGNGEGQVIARVEITRSDTKAVTTFDGLVHKMFPRLLKNVARGQHVYLPGPPGSSKSHSAALVANAIDWRFGSISLGPTTPESRLVGGMDANGNFHQTSLTAGVAYAAEHTEAGFVFILDEMDNGHPGNIATLNSLLANGWITLPDGTTLTIGRNLVFIGCANTFGTGPTAEFAGRNRLDAATLDRFSYLPWDTDLGLEKALVEAELGAMGDDGWLVAKDWLATWNTARSNVADHGLKVFVTMRGAIAGAIALADGDDLKTVLMEKLGNKLPEDQWRKVNPL